ncbi:MAG: hypothetical protein QOH60_3551 [Mycobacterium sp.]|jgi:hypothetical protein|nr:hypothetical protein [Mycobacterium sp.]
MATVDVSVKSALRPDDAWALASDLDRFDEWLTIFGGWRSPVPKQIEKGTRVASCVKVKGFRNVINWEVTEYEPPKRLAMKGSGRGGVRITLTLTIDEDGAGSRYHLVAKLAGGLLNSPVGNLVAKVLKADVNKSVSKLAQLQAA